MANRIVETTPGLEILLAREGERAFLFADGSGTITVAGQNTNTQIGGSPSQTVDGRAFALPYSGRMLWLEHVDIALWGLVEGSSAYVQMFIPAVATSKALAFYYRTVVKSGESVRIPIRQFLRPRDIHATIGTPPGIAFTTRGFFPALGVDTTVRMMTTVLGVYMTDDIDFGAPKVALIVGDSQSYGDAYGASQTHLNWHFKVRDYLKSLGNRIRVVSIAQPGRTTSDAAIDSLQSRYDAIDSNIVFYALGTNDAILAASGYVDTYEANLRSFWARHAAQKPRVPLVVIPPGPLNDDAEETRGALIRARAASVVSSIANPFLKVIDIGTAFNRATTSFFRPADKIHWSDTGHAAVAAAVETGLAAQSVRVA